LVIAINIVQSILAQNILHFVGIVYFGLDIVQSIIFYAIEIVYFVLNLVILVKLKIATRARISALIFATVFIGFVHPFLTGWLFWGLAVIFQEIVAEFYNDEFRKCLVVYKK